MKSSGKKIIGLTGGFGSGKSTVANMFRQLGIPVVDADQLAHEALGVESPIYQGVKRMFPEACFDDREGLDPRKVAAVVFSDAGRRKELELLVHPYVFERMAEAIRQTKETVVIAEVPLLFETGYERLCDHILVVETSEEIIDKRLYQKGFSEQEVRQRREAQMPLQGKVKRADFVICNSGTEQQTRREVEEVWKKLRPDSKGEK